MKKLFLSAFVVLIAGGFAGCTDKSRRAEIEQRRAALVAKQDSALAEAQQRLGEVDNLLEKTKLKHDSLHAWVMAHSTRLNESSPQVQELNRLRQHRDSLQVEWETLGAKIKYIRKVMDEQRESLDRK